MKLPQRATIVIMLLNAAIVAGAPRRDVPETGDRAGHPFTLSDVDSIDNVTGNVSLTIPIASLPAGRGGMALGVNLIYNSAQVHVSVSGDTHPVSNSPLHHLESAYNGSTWNYGGFSFGFGNEYRFGNFSCFPLTPEADKRWRLWINLPDGSRRMARLYPRPGKDMTDANGDGFYAYNVWGVDDGCSADTYNAGPMVYYTTDASNIRVEFRANGCNPAQYPPVSYNWMIYMPDGTRAGGCAAAGSALDSASAVWDRNGNIVTIFGELTSGGSILRLDDSQSRWVRIFYENPVNNPLHDTITWYTPEVGGEVAKIAKVYYGLQHVSGVLHYCTGTDLCAVCAPTDTACLNWNNNPGAYALTFMPVTKIELPTTSPATTIDFNYDCPSPPCWRELRKAETKVGNAFKHRVEYKYEFEGAFSTRGGGGVDLADLVDNPVKEKKFCFQALCLETGNDPVSEKWTFQRTNSSSIAIGPDGVTEHYFYDPRGVWDWRHGLEWKTVLPDNSSVQRKWAQNFPPNSPTSDPGNPYVSRQVRGAPATNDKCTAVDLKVDQNNNTRQRSETDFSSLTCDALVNASSVTYLRTTVSDYHAETPDAVAASPVDDPDAYWHPRNDSGWSPLTSERNVRALKRTEVRIGGAAGTIKAASQHLYDDAKRTANLTTEFRWDNTKGSITTPLTASNAISITRTYNSYGELVSEADPNGNTEVITYGSSYPSQRSLASLRLFTYDYTFLTGLVKSVADDNGLTREFEYDPLQRIRFERERFDGAVKRVREFVYNDTVVSSAGQASIRVKRDRDAVNDQALYQETTYDVRGRALSTQRYSLAAGSNVKVDMRYRWSGGFLHEMQSNPYTVTPDGYSVTLRDSQGRTVARRKYGAGLPAPWGSNATILASATTSFSSNTATSTEESGATRSVVFDAFGRVSEVTENGESSSRTQYFYDVLDNLEKVVHGTAGTGYAQPCGSTPTTTTEPLTRKFAYTSLSRLQSACNPESGTTLYTYDKAGNMLKRTDARGAVLCYGTLSGSSCPETGGYDGLNRPLRKTYSDTTPQVSYSYDGAINGKGKLHSAALVGTSTSTTFNEYDKFGRTLKSTQSLGGTSYQFQYTYNLADTLKTMIYPHSGRVITYTTNLAGEVTGVTGTKGGVNSTYASEMTYSPHGALNKMRFGTSATQYQQACFNAGLLVSRVRVASSTSLCTQAATGAESLQLEYTYASGGVAGNVGSQTIRRGASIWSQNYAYDGRDRLTSVGDSAFSQGYAYDVQGNMALVVNQTTLTPATSDLLYPNVATASANVHTIFPKNRWNGGAYDAAGNQTGVNNGTFTFAYDAEGRMKSATAPGMPAITYGYDAEGRRITKTVGSAQTSYIYDASGRLALEFGAHTLGAGAHFLASDALGSMRLMLNAAGAVERCYDYTPFGTEVGGAYRGGMACFGSAAYPGNPDVISGKYTGKERDAETGLDYFGARYMSSAQGRFTSPDPVWVTPNRMIDPQELNLYVYVRNNPLKYVDPDGTILELAASSEEDAKKKFALIQRGLTPADRRHVQLVSGDGKNGFAKGHFGITADKDHRSSSGNFQTLQGTANSKDLAIAAIVSPSARFSSNVGVQDGAQVVVATFASKFGQDNYVSSKDAVPGQTLFQLLGSPLADAFYSAERASRIYVANDQADSEIVKTFFHELRHVYLGDFGRSIPKGSHPAADRDIQSIERESDRNFGGAPARKK